jgi:large subunit ribosomal protein L4
MLTARYFSVSGEPGDALELPEDLFDGVVNEAVLHQVIKAYLANQRQGNASTKTRAEVSGGNSKVWKQKGTGRARQGSRTAPHYKGGGVVFGPHPRSYEQKLPKKMRRLALRSALTAKFGDDAIRVVDHFGMDAEPKTRAFAAILQAIGAGDGHERRVLVVAPAKDELLLRSAANLPSVSVILADSLNVVDLLNADAVVIEQPALARMEEVYS